MVSKTFILAAVVAYVEARFGQENIPIGAIGSVQGGGPGAAATIAGAAISDLLGGANSCNKLVRADQIFSELGGGADALAAAIGMVTAEKNTNPFANGNVQNVCGDASLPVTPELRGITPLIDPAVDVDGDAAALSQSTAGSPLNANGLSVFDLMDQAGLGGLVASQNSVGGNQAADDDDQAADDDDQAADDDDQAADDEEEEEEEDDEDDNNQVDQNACNLNANADANDAAEEDEDEDEDEDDNAGAAAGGEDFGLCTPTITFQGGENGRPADEFTFQIADAFARGGQQEALNPDIITNALCNQLTNVCEANDAAIATCESAAAAVQGGTRNKALADTFNELIGFPGAVTNPAGGPDDVAARRMRRGLRL